MAAPDLVAFSETPDAEKPVPPCRSCDSECVMHNSCYDNKHATVIQLLDKCTLPLISCHDN